MKEKDKAKSAEKEKEKSKGSEKEEDFFSEEDQAKVKERLKSLGYLD